MRKAAVGCLIEADEYSTCRLEGVFLGSLIRFQNKLGASVGMVGVAGRRSNREAKSNNKVIVGSRMLLDVQYVCVAEQGSQELVRAG